MAKWFGTIGYAIDEETRPGVWEKKITERQYYGDLIRNTRKLESSGQVNDNVIIADDISIISDPYAVEHFHSMLYAECFGSKWKILSVDVQYPRLTLTLGGLYNG